MTPAVLPRRDPVAPPVRKCPECLAPMTVIIDGHARCSAGHVFRSHLDELHLRRDRIATG